MDNLSFEKIVHDIVESSVEDYYVLEVFAKDLSSLVALSSRVGEDSALINNQSVEWELLLASKLSN